MLFKNKNIDEKVIKNIGLNFSKSNTNYIHKIKKVIKKPWGYEYCYFSNKKLALWVLTLKSKQSTSMHAHLKKKTFLINTKSITFSDLNNRYKIKPNTILKIDKRTFHQSLNLSNKDIIIFEIEIPNDKLDLLRFKDKYSRDKTLYEKKIITNNRIEGLRKKINKKYFDIFLGRKKNKAKINKNDIVLLLNGKLVINKKRIPLYTPTKMRKNYNLIKYLNFDHLTNFISIKIND